jgi:hypothetical protein
VVSFGLSSQFNPSDSAWNTIEFIPYAFNNVAVGQEFTIGRLEYQNGGWFGGSLTQGFSRPSIFDFTLSTVSSSGAPFVQTIAGRIVHEVRVAPTGADLTDPLNQQLEADLISVYFGKDLTCVNCSFAVYEDLGSPAFFPSGIASNRGSVEVRAKFGSLLFAGLANPTSGFVTQGTPPGGGGGGGVGVIPEPSTWMLMILGFGLIAQQLRRRHLAAA